MKCCKSLPDRIEGYPLIKVWVEERLVLREASDKGGVKLKLFQCPVCSAHWLFKAECVGLQDWDYTLMRTTDSRLV